MRKSILMWLGCTIPAWSEMYQLELKDLGIEEIDIEMLERRASYDSGNIKFRVPEGIQAYFVSEKIKKKRKKNKQDQEIWGEQTDYDVVGFKNVIVINAQKNENFKGFLDGADKEYVFEFNPKKYKPIKKEVFEKYKKLHYAKYVRSNRWQDSTIGEVYFRTLAGDAAPTTIESQGEQLESSTMSVFSGGHAIAENIALNRSILLGDKKEGESVNIQDIRGVTVEPIDWKPLLKNVKEVKKHDLIKLIPENQHVALSPSMASLLEVVETVESNSVLMQSFSSRNPFRQLTDKYRQQMGLNAPNAVAKKFDVGAVAITGGDPFFPTGTDVAVIFEKSSPAITLYISSAANKAKAQSSEGKIGDYSYISYMTSDRSFSSYVMKFDGALVVANSVEQLKALVGVKEGTQKSLHETDEYKYFRHRYPLKDVVAGKEDVFVYISDECLRRWCGPKVRIGASRRNKATAAMMELTSKQLIKYGKDYSKHPQLEQQVYAKMLGNVRWGGSNNVLDADKYNTLSFMTPVAELDLKVVSQKEKLAYEEWREGYETGWNTVYDPIAVRVNVTDKEILLDVSVLPLRADSDYQDVAALLGKVGLSAASVYHGDESMMTLAVAFDKDSAEIKQVGEQINSFYRRAKKEPLEDPFAWLAGPVSVSLAKDQKFMNAVEAPDEEQMFNILPILLRAELTDSKQLTEIIDLILKDAGFDLKVKEKTYNGNKISTIDLGFCSMNIHFCITDKVAYLTLREDIIKKALDREKELPKGMVKNDILKHLFWKTDAASLLGWSSLIDSGLYEMREMQSHRALPILNEMRLLNPDRDPVDFYNTLFGSYVHCPSEKSYVWDEKNYTMKSQVYGYSKGSTSVDKGFEDFIGDIGDIESSIEFEHGGVRARMKIQKK